jgi:topoisomerase IA-like protein
MTGAERDKLRTTPLGRTVIEWLVATFEDLCDYGFTAAMEAALDSIASSSSSSDFSSSSSTSRIALLTDTWDRYKDRYNAIMTTPAPTSSSKMKELGDGYKVVMSRKGPLFVLEKEGAKTQFASLPTTLTIATATKEDAVAAFTTGTAGTGSGDAIGEIEGDPVVRKKGPHGHYVTWRTYNVSCTADEVLDSLAPRLLAKVDALDHTIGPFKIRKGAYGLYMFRMDTKGKPAFVGIPDTTPYTTLTVEGAEALYKEHNVAKTKTKTFKKK